MGIARVAPVSLLLLVSALPACDFGTLDDFSSEEAVEGSEETTLQARAVWRFYPRPDDDVRRAIDDIDGVVTRVGAYPVQVKIGDLTKDDLALVGKTTDPGPPQGMLLVSDLDCSLAEAEKLVVAKNQTALYPGLYDTYERNFAPGSSIQDYLAGRSRTVVWRTDYTASLLDRTYASNLTGEARRVPGASPRGGDVVLARTVLNEPARFLKGGDAEFNQDYQIEAFYEIEPRKVRHFYALWREFRVSGLTSESDLYVNIVLGNLRDFDVRSSKICRDGAPAASFE